ncbi:hypothetical protein TNCV_4869221 [Trichonephila clavipes]|nr:hypothetical protein TNCV_4869221 [Trichonephila clavipes]
MTCMNRSNDMLDRSNDMLTKNDMGQVKCFIPQRRLRRGSSTNEMLDRSNETEVSKNSFNTGSNDMLDNDMLDRSNDIFGERPTSF